MLGDLIFLLQLLYYVDRFPVNYYNGFGQELLPVIFVYAAKVFYAAYVFLAVYVFHAAYVSSMENIQMHKGIFKRFLAGSAALLLTAVSVLAGPSPLLRSTAYAGQSAVVQASALNVRSGPGTSYSRVDELVNGSQVIIEEEVQGDDGKVWAKISFSGGSGYVQKAYLGTTVSYSGSSDSNFEAQLSEQGFPESYRVWLRAVHAQYPNWIFRADHVGVDWEEVIRNESVIGRNLVEKSSASSWKSTESGAFDWASNYWPGFDGSNWVAASEAVIRYYMDPRNFLNTSYIFQFQTHSYNASTQTAEGVEKITEGTFMAGRASGSGSGSGPTPDGSAGPAPDGGVSPTPDSGAAVPAGDSGAGQTSGSAGQTPAGGTVGIAPGSIGSQTTAEITQTAETSQAPETSQTPETTQAAAETTQAASPETALTEQAGISPSGEGTGFAGSPVSGTQSQSGSSGSSSSGSISSGNTSSGSSESSSSSGSAPASSAPSGGEVIGVITGAPTAKVFDTLNVGAKAMVIGPDGRGYDDNASSGPGASGSSSGGSSSGAQSGDGSVNYIDIIMRAAQESSVNPYVLTAMILQEQGKNGTSDLISGRSSNYPGIYNFFNIQAYDDGTMSAVTRGLWWASQAGSYGRPWNSIEKAIIGGADCYGENFVREGQDTFYLKKFNVTSKNRYQHQYMTNVEGAASEGFKLGQAYSESLKQQALVFRIPVYTGMPETAASCPTKDGSPNNKLKALSVDGFSITPSFSMDVNSYDLIVDPGVQGVNVSASTIDSGATVQGTGWITLSGGTAQVTVTVTAANGDVRSYTINVAKQAGGQAGNGAQGGDGSSGGSGPYPEGGGDPSASGPGFVNSDQSGFINTDQSGISSSPAPDSGAPQAGSSGTVQLVGPSGQ